MAHTGLILKRGHDLSKVLRVLDRRKGIVPLEKLNLVRETLTSLQVMELIEQIEDHFDMSIPLNILPDIRTVHDLATQLEKLDS